MTFDPTKHVYPMHQAATATVERAEEAAKQAPRGLRFPIPYLRDYCANLLPGRIAQVLAQTSNYKSAFIRLWEKDAIAQLQEQKRNEAIVHVTVEDYVEEIIANWIASEAGLGTPEFEVGDVRDWQSVRIAAGRLASKPFFLIGASLKYADDIPTLHMSNILKCLESIKTGEITGVQVQIGAIFYDYLQAFAYDPEIARIKGAEQRRLQVREDMFRIRKSAAYFNTPVVFACQAKQTLDGAPSKEFQTPGMYDGKEASEIAEHSDRIYSLWMPARTHGINSTYNHKMQTYTAYDNSLWLRVVKQRGKLPAGRVYPFRADFANDALQKDEMYWKD
jgi:hypothetical protein